MLKEVYLENKQNRRVDKPLHVLFRIARNLGYEQLRKEEKGKTTHHKSEINKRHKSALAIADTCQVLELSKEEWKVQLQGNQDVFYIVQLLQSSCTCKLSCCHCGACVHMHNCSCLDSAIHNTVCKHSH